MSQTSNKVIAQCPNPRCNKPIRLNHSYSWCTGCDNPLPESILSQLPKIQKLKIEAAIERGKQEDSRAAQRIDEQIKVIEGDYLVIPFIGRIKSSFFSTENAETVDRKSVV